MATHTPLESLIAEAHNVDERTNAELTARLRAARKLLQEKPTPEAIIQALLSVRSEMITRIMRRTERLQTMGRAANVSPAKVEAARTPEGLQELRLVLMYRIGGILNTVLPNLDSNAKAQEVATALVEKCAQFSQLCCAILKAATSPAEGPDGASALDTPPPPVDPKHPFLQ